MEIFDKEASSYDQWYQTKMGNFIDQVETGLAFNLFNVKEGIKVLDIGCGTGNFSIKLAQKGCKVIGIDVSEEMLSIAKKKAEKAGLDIQFYHMDVYDLKFEDESFDAVFSMAAFEFVKEPQKAIDEVFRVAKKGSKILIGTINKDSQWGELYLSESFQENSVFKHADFKTLDHFRSLKNDNLIDTGECLFISPDTKEQDINMENERVLSNSKRGGFICALWEK